MVVILPPFRCADVAKLADAQPSEGCDRKVMEVQLLRPHQQYCTGTMSFRHALLLTALAALFPALSPAQILDQIKKPFDLSKQADVNDKTVTFGDLHYGTVSQPTRVISRTSPLTKGDLHQQQMELNQVDLKSVEMSTLPEPVLPQVNYSAKRAAVDKVNDQGNRQLDQTKQKAPINSRQIRTSTPGGRRGTEETTQYSSSVTWPGYDIIQRLNL